MSCHGPSRLLASGAAAFAAAAACAPDAAAQDYEVIAGVGFDSIGVFRGVRSRKLNPSPYAFVEGVYGPFVVGAFASPVSIADRTQSLILSYASWEPSLGGFDFASGVRYYAFTDPRDFVFDFDNDGVPEHQGEKHLFEGSLSIARQFPGGRIKLATFYTPDGFARTGAGYYATGEARAALFSGIELRVSGAVSRFEDDLYNDDYADFGVGLYRSAWGLDFYLKYSDTLGLAGADDSTLAFGVERAFTLFSGDGEQRRRERKIVNNWSIDKSQIGAAGIAAPTAD